MSISALVIASVLLSAPAPAPARVVIVLSAVEQLPKAGSATGNYLQEVAYPVMKLTEAGIAVDFVTPGGRDALVRGNEAYGLAPDAARDPLLRAFTGQYLDQHGLMRQMRRPADLRAAEYAGVFYAGSLGALIDLAADAEIAKLAAEIHDRGGFVAASGHGIAGLLPVRTRSGEPLLRNRRVAPFTRDEDVAFFQDRLGWRDVLPYHIEERVREAGAVVEKKEKFAVNVVQDGRVVTGQNAGSVRRLTEVLLELVKDRSGGAAEDKTAHR